MKVGEWLGITEPPSLYFVQSGGLRNTLATRFAGRDFVVVYSDFLDALGVNTPEMRFLGHELGHIRSRHVLNQIVLAPSLFFPLAGPFTAALGNCPQIASALLPPTMSMAKFRPC